MLLESAENKAHYTLTRPIINDITVNKNWNMGVTILNDSLKLLIFLATVSQPVRFEYEQSLTYHFIVFFFFFLQIGSANKCDVIKVHSSFSLKVIVIGEGGVSSAKGVNHTQN